MNNPIKYKDAHEEAIHGENFFISIRKLDIREWEVIELKTKNIRDFIGAKVLSKRTYKTYRGARVRFNYLEDKYTEETI